MFPDAEDACCQLAKLIKRWGMAHTMGDFVCMLSWDGVPQWTKGYYFIQQGPPDQICVHALRQRSCVGPSRLLLEGNRKLQGEWEQEVAEGDVMVLGHSWSCDTQHLLQ